MSLYIVVGLWVAIILVGAQGSWIFWTLITRDQDTVGRAVDVTLFPIFAFAAYSIWSAIP